MRRLSLALALSLAALAAVGSLASSPVVASAPLERVIVVLHPEVNLPEDVALQVANVMDGNVGFVYHHALNGFSLELPAAAVAALEQSPLVAYVEPDIEVSVVQLGSQPVPTGVDRVEADLNPPAGPVDADIAVLDTGIWHGPGLSSHEDLNLTVVSDCTDAIFYPIFGGCAAGPTANFQDEHGHGTHVAGIAAAIDNDIGIIGTAPGARLWSIKVAGADGTALLGSILAGVDLVAANAPEIEVANVSLTMTGSSTALNDALSNATSAGVVFVVAAGNSSADAAGFSPANHPNVITASAVADFDGLPGGIGAATCRPDVDDTLADFSNWGSSIDIAAPGVCIYSTYLNDGYATASGTSMASPAVAGAVARYIAETGNKPSNLSEVQAVKDALVGDGIPQDDALCGFTDDPDSFPEPLLFMNGPLFGGDGTCESQEPPPENVPPVASFSVSCDQLVCSFDGSGSSDADGTVVAWEWDFGDSSSDVGEIVSHTYSSGGERTVTLKVTDNDGDTDSTSRTANPLDPNVPPVASFSVSCDQLVCSLDGSGSSDADGTVVAWEWIFGDSSSDVGEMVSHTYSSGGERTVTLKVTDNDGDTDSTTGTADPTDPPPAWRAAGDFDGQNGDDVVEYLPEGGDLAVRRSTGSAFLDETWGTLGTSSGWERHLVGDFSGDGRDDVASFNKDDGKWSVSLSTASFVTQVWADFTTTSGWEGRVVGDFDGDGRDDVAQFHPSNGTWWVSVSTGSEFVTRVWANFTTRSGWEGRVVGDFDGDGRDDVAQFHPSNGTWWVSVSTGSAFMTTRWATTGSSWERHLVGDFSGDGRDDVASFNPSDGTWWVSVSTGSGFVTQVWADFTTTSGWEGRVVGDFDGDGRDDVAQFHPSNGTWWVSLSTGSEFVTRVWANFTTRSGWEGRVVGDFDGDGRDDVAQFHPSNGTWWVSLSTGSGFVTRVWLN